MKNYSLKEIFLTVQGEGSRAGALSVFVRFAGCNLWDGNPEHRAQGKGACAKWCDTDFAKGSPFSLDALIQSMNQAWTPESQTTKWCVLTGGEPALQIDDALIDALKANGWSIAVETNGSIANTSFKKIDLLTVSPKRFAPIALPMEKPKGIELKVVLPGDENNPWAPDDVLKLAVQTNANFVYVQPQDPINPKLVQSSYLHPSIGSGDDLGMFEEQYARNVKRCFDFVASYPHARISGQLHKTLNLA